MIFENERFQQSPAGDFMESPEGERDTNALAAVITPPTVVKATQTTRPLGAITYEIVHTSPRIESAFSDVSVRHYLDNITLTFSSITLSTPGQTYTVIGDCATSNLPHPYSVQQWTGTPSVDNVYQSIAWIATDGVRTVTDTCGAANPGGDGGFDDVAMKPRTPQEYEGDSEGGRPRLGVITLCDGGSKVIDGHTEFTFNFPNIIEQLEFINITGIRNLTRPGLITVASTSGAVASCWEDIGNDAVMSISDVRFDFLNGSDYQIQVISGALLPEDFQPFDLVVLETI